MWAGKLNEVQVAQNGAKLKGVEVSEQPSVIPDGALHKNKHHIDLDGITNKGIPVITTDAGTVESLQEIKNGGNIIQHCEIEVGEVIFSKELTDYVEENRINKNDLDVQISVGKRITKELIMNCNDNAELIENV